MKKHTHKEYIGVDACAVNLMRPAMYGAYHHITVMGKETNQQIMYMILQDLFVKITINLRSTVNYQNRHGRSVSDS